MAGARVHLIIHGRVQGVFFRASAREQAVSLGLVGWVRNRRDGTVEVVAEGDGEKLEKLLEWCHKGPPAAKVTKVDQEWGEATGEFSSFSLGFAM